MVARLIEEFDLWQPGYGGATVYVYRDDGTTLADLFYDEAMTQSAPQPQVLLRRTFNGHDVEYGKFNQSIYVGIPYKLDITGVHRSGVHRLPILDLTDLDISDARVRLEGFTTSQSLDRWFAEDLRARAFGLLQVQADPATNTDIIQQALGYAASNGYGFVHLPASLIPITQLVIPTNVKLKGQGEEQTILQSQVADKVITLEGGNAGMHDLTLDGVNLRPDSIGIYGDFQRSIELVNVTVKRFDIGAQWDGGRYHRYYRLSIDNCNVGMRVDTPTAKRYVHAIWDGGQVMFCTDFGLDLQESEQRCGLMLVQGVTFRDNADVALRIFGGKHVHFMGCEWRDNVEHMLIRDRDIGGGVINQAAGIHVVGGRMTDGRVELRDTCQDVQFSSMEISNHIWTFVSVVNAIRLVDVLETGTQALNGDTTSIRRDREQLRGQSTEVAESATFETIWSETLVPGNVMTASAWIVGRSLNSDEVWGYHRHCIARRPPAVLTIKNVATAFDPGEVIAGGTSGSSARVVDVNALELSLIAIVGNFVDNESLTGDLGGGATTDGVLAFSPVEILRDVIPTGEGATPARYEDDPAVIARFQGTTTRLEVQVQSAAGKSVEWVARVEQARTT